MIQDALFKSIIFIPINTSIDCCLIGWVIKITLKPFQACRTHQNLYDPGSVIVRLDIKEEKGLISASRQENNYREYDEQVIESIHSIQLYLKLGLTTDQIREVIFYKDQSKGID
ncbi:MerR family transcriptional regulator [Brevibacillus brevis]|uniref:MerR family transcriptional regulator n=1 Tax=Brevibacillus brevis TaxID=1393 RepID=A0ABY9T098_BREBE|nr:MerR family transcriptional regulator [Brevibacillus brevis]WNC13523.1 MerR family transcriptional regulator [Brevibacillus brevis]